MNNTFKLYPQLLTSNPSDTTVLSLYTLVSPNISACSVGRRDIPLIPEARQNYNVRVDGRKNSWIICLISNINDEI